MVEPEDAMQWRIVHPSENVSDSTLVDRVVTFAAERNMKVCGDTLPER